MDADRALPDLHRTLMPQTSPQRYAQSKSRSCPGNGPGALGGSSVIQRDRPTPDIGSSDKPEPGPAPAGLPSQTPTRERFGPATATSRRRAGGVNVKRHRTNDVGTEQHLALQGPAGPRPLDTRRNGRVPRPIALVWQKSALSPVQAGAPVSGNLVDPASLLG